MNGQIELLKQREGLVRDELASLKDKSKNVSDKDLNKHWPFPSYDLCFTTKTLQYINLLLPTAMIRLECDGIIYGPFRALLDTGAQPNLISYTLFKLFKCVTTQAIRRILGVDSKPFSIKRKAGMIIRPWFRSDIGYRDDFLILPQANDWKPLLPSTEMKVHRKDEEFRQSLADPSTICQRRYTSSWELVS